jgi:AcrR family transcriptional regulator
MDAQRQALIDAAHAIVKRDGPDSLSTAATAAEAGVGFDVFCSHFPDEPAFIAALHQSYMDTLLEHIGVATRRLPAGAHRLRAGVLRFLDVSLRKVRVRKALQRLRATSPVAAAQMDLRHRAFAHLLATELAAAGWPTPVESARLLRSMIEETARAEFQALRELPRLRAALSGFIDSGDTLPVAVRTGGARAA